MSLSQPANNINLSLLYTDTQLTVSNVNFAGVARVYLEHVFGRVQHACVLYAQAHANNAQLGRCMAATTRILNKLMAPWIEDESINVREGGQIPTPDTFFHASTHTNHLLRVLAPENDAVIRCDVLLPLCAGLANRFDPWPVAVYAARVILMQCIDFARTQYSQEFARLWVQEPLQPSHNLTQTPPTASLLCTLYLVRLLETAFNSIVYLPPDITTECVL